MKARDRIDKVRRILEARRNVRDSLALARRKEAEGVKQRQHPPKPEPTPKAPDDPSRTGTG
jgi:hypothetical protein